MMGECPRSSSFYNPTLSANKHVQFCRFSPSAAADLADGSRAQWTSPFNCDAHSWNGIERSLSLTVVPQSLPVSTITTPTAQHCLCRPRRGACERISAIQTVLKGRTVATWTGKTHQFGLFFVLEVRQRNGTDWVIDGRLTSEHKASTFLSSFINLSIPPLRRQGSCLYMLAWISLLHSAFLHQWSHECTRAPEYRVTQ